MVLEHYRTFWDTTLARVHPDARDLCPTHS
jgi:hypothetical protein